MPKTKYKIIPPENKEDLWPIDSLNNFKCGDCSKTIPGWDLVEHAETQHHANSILVDTTINWGEIARKKKEKQDVDSIP